MEGFGLRRRYPSQPVVGVEEVISAEGKLVLVKKSAEPAMNKWSIPRGAVELGETVGDAALREARELCGLDIELIDDRPMDAFNLLAKDEGASPIALCPSSVSGSNIRGNLTAYQRRKGPDGFPEKKYNNTT